MAIEATQMREQMRDLARDFPGALRELDELPLEVIEHRLARVTVCTDPEAWMIATSCYHKALKALLAAKANSQASPPDGSLMDAAVTAVANEMGISLREADELVFAGLRRRRPAGTAT